MTISTPYISTTPEGPSLDKVADLGYAVSQITLYTVTVSVCVPVSYFIASDLNQKSY